MKYDTAKSHSPKMPVLGKGTKSSCFPPSQVPQRDENDPFLLLFSLFGALRVRTKSP